MKTIINSHINTVLSIPITYKIQKIHHFKTFKQLVLTREGWASRSNKADARNPDCPTTSLIPCAHAMKFFSTPQQHDRPAVAIAFLPVGQAFVCASDPLRRGSKLLSRIRERHLPKKLIANARIYPMILL
jgi:hypothetical protein